MKVTTEYESISCMCYVSCTCYLEVALFLLYTLTKLVEFVLFCAVFLLFSKYTCTSAAASHTRIAIVYIVTSPYGLILMYHVFLQVLMFFGHQKKRFQTYMMRTSIHHKWGSRNQKLDIQR